MSDRSYFIYANTYAAPIVSDVINTYATGPTPEDALAAWLATQGDTIYAASIYDTADAFHRREPELDRWLSPRALEHMRAT